MHNREPHKLSVLLAYFISFPVMRARTHIVCITHVNDDALINLFPGVEPQLIDSFFFPQPWRYLNDINFPSIILT